MTVGVDFAAAAVGQEEQATVSRLHYFPRIQSRQSNRQHFLQ